MWCARPANSVAWASGRTRVQIRPYCPPSMRGGGGGGGCGDDAAVVWTRDMLADAAVLNAARADAGCIVGVLLSPPLAAAAAAVAAVEEASTSSGRVSVTSTQLAVLPLAPPLLDPNGLLFFEGGQTAMHVRVRVRDRNGGTRAERHADGSMGGRSGEQGAHRGRGGAHALMGVPVRGVMHLAVASTKQPAGDGSRSDVPPLALHAAHRPPRCVSAPSL